MLLNPEDTIRHIWVVVKSVEGAKKGYTFVWPYAQGTKTVEVNPDDAAYFSEFLAEREQDLQPGQWGLARLRTAVFKDKE